MSVVPAACTLPPLPSFSSSSSPPSYPPSLSFSRFLSPLRSSLDSRRPSTASMRVRPTRLKLVPPINRVNCSQHPRSCGTCALIYCATLRWPWTAAIIVTAGINRSFALWTCTRARKGCLSFSHFNKRASRRCRADIYDVLLLATSNFPGIIRARETSLIRGIRRLPSDDISMCLRS